MQLRAIDLFAGSGLFSRGAEEAGIEIVWAGNHWQVAVDCYAANHPILPKCQDLHQQDWTQVPGHDRLIVRYSNEGDLVFDPFGGLMTVPVRALHLGRKGRGVELNPGYFLDGVKYLQAKEREKAMPTLFDTLPDMDRAA